jgi:hypothetical protein
MAVLIEDVFPVGVTIELLDAVTDEMGVDAELPPGGIVHVHFERTAALTVSTSGNRSRLLSSSSSQRFCQPWARLRWQEVWTRQSWENPK